MTITKRDFEGYIKNFDLRGLFIDMGWHKDDLTESISIENEVYTLQSIAEQSGFRIFIASASTGTVSGGRIPLYKVRRLIENKIARIAHDHLIIFVDTRKTEQVWLLVTRQLNQRVRVSEVSWKTGKSVELLYERTAGLVFEMEDEDKITIIDVTKRASSFNQNNEAVTRKFYEGFKKEHDVFQEFISGIGSKLDKDWYASLMLNRLMFSYFIQKRRFLDGDTDYLAHKLKSCRAAQGKDTFYSFYRSFLKVLFHQGFASPRHDDALVHEIGKIPYLNGGLFDVHELETKHTDIDIKDDAFEKIFAFFDAYQWTLDTRSDSKGDEINPDVIGYIFEKYINDRAQMGAYYTKEDITEYIGKNCIIPHLFDAITRNYPHLFVENGDAEKMIRASGRSYIYDAVKKGVDEKLPGEIEKGITNVADRGEWNKPALSEYALPTEIWRETVARRQRCSDVEQKINAGDVRHINDFITYNLNIRQFAQDIIEDTGDAKLVKAYWDALNSMTILDPTCGSGAFLFAALNILVPLYDSCITRMRGFVEDEDRANSENRGSFRNELQEFREILSDIQNPKHPNQSYYVYKTIILNNLYGVDIMREAVEIAKLRLFLKLVSTVEVDHQKPNLGLEPLPDIDFNLRCGNTLVGFAAKKEIQDVFKLELFKNEDELKAILENCSTLASEFKHFQEVQLLEGTDGYSCKKVKSGIQKHLDELRSGLNGYLALVYGINAQTEKERYAEWLATHQPFHWFAEFYRIIALNGGFDVVIGNPPYVVYTPAKFAYKVTGYKTITCGNLYAYCVERGIQLSNIQGKFGMIVPNSCVSADKHIPLQKLLLADNSTWISNYAWRPSKLFEGANMLLAIVLSSLNTQGSTFTTRYNRWQNVERNHLFEIQSYTDVNTYVIAGSIPKIYNKLALSIIDTLKRNSNDTVWNNQTLQKTKSVLYYFRAVLYWFKILTKAPVFLEDSKQKETGEMKPLYFDSDTKRDTVISILTSSLYYFYYTTWASCQVVNSRDFQFPFSFSNIDKKLFDILTKYGKELQEDYQKNSIIQKREYASRGRSFTMQKQYFYVKKSKPIIDEIDKVLAKHYGFTDEELDFIINYDIKYRMGGELGEEED